MIRIFRHYISRWSVFLVVLEAALFFGAVYAGVGIRFSGFSDLEAGLVEVLFPRAVFFALVMVVSMAATGRYQRVMVDGFTGEVLNVTLSFIIGLVAISLQFYVFPDLLIGRGSFGYTLTLAWAGVLLVRWFFIHHIFDVANLKRRVLVIGTGNNARLVWERSQRARTDHLILGFWPVAGCPEAVPRQQLLEGGEDLAECVARLMVDEVVVATDEPLSAMYMSDIMTCKSNGVRILDLLAFFEREDRVIDMEILDAQWWIFNADGVGPGPVRAASKKVFDVVISLLLLSLTWPLMLFTALAILVESGRPVFYAQRRVGYGGKIFTVLKFRSMYADAEKDGVARWVSRGDARVTRVGRFIRASRIDELPQFFNVLRGEMSLVGPRPERPEFVEPLRRKIPFYAERLRVKPGITGWAQISYGYGASDADAAEKLKYDLYYVKNQSFFLDLLVLVLSVEVVLFGRGVEGPRDRGGSAGMAK
ncbi:MAG: TIGR03013 family PEP-CTERM/XrtA system glycosyltransferase [Magnetococcales bacterium]|nr:TIGR03013 family PEP-CTERM/XrtA system glycosyltransferase [Magnetococcales bacterium]MBF0156543.1 TIGR03013 family PEP-CTERM/XrtA system glycosyltransferase [Magnetococcales bacterium]